MPRPAHLHRDRPRGGIRIADEQHVLDAQRDVVVLEPLADLLGGPVRSLSRQAAEIIFGHNEGGEALVRQVACEIGERGGIAGFDGVRGDDHVVVGRLRSGYDDGRAIPTRRRREVEDHRAGPDVHDLVGQLGVGGEPHRGELVADPDGHAGDHPQAPGHGVVLERRESDPGDPPLAQAGESQILDGVFGEIFVQVVHARIRIYDPVLAVPRRKGRLLLDQEGAEIDGALFLRRDLDALDVDIGRQGHVEDAHRQGGIPGDARNRVARRGDQLGSVRLGRNAIGRSGQSDLLFSGGQDGRACADHQQRSRDASYDRPHGSPSCDP